MQTYSHLLGSTTARKWCGLVTAALDRPLKSRGIAVHTPAFLLGAVLPDLPFFMFTIMGSIYYTWVAPVPTGESPMVYMHFTLYFTDPLWLATHNFFHAPLILMVIGLLGYWGVHTIRDSSSRWGLFLLWFVLGVALHSFIDIFTHAADGPLLLFPLNWTLRFNSPVSYWDPEHYGLIFVSLEHLLDFALLVYLSNAWWKRRCTTGVTTRRSWP